MTTGTDSSDPLRMHATAVAIAGAGLMLCGESGSGKSDLALRLIDRGATLVSDDYVTITKRGVRLFLSPPATIAGKLEVRALGIFERDHLSDVALQLVVNLKQDPDRYPLDRQVMILLGLAVPCCTLDAMECSAAIKAEWALQRAMQEAAAG